MKTNMLADILARRPDQAFLRIPPNETVETRRRNDPSQDSGPDAFVSLTGPFLAAHRRLCRQPEELALKSKVPGVVSV